ncbi:RNA polymerase sigma factor [Paraglaciecola sp. 2405UD69-4]|uniref:RNA polymerase sigma factor n=1 Tax=Paraglaciecola sp. 2405UD69-4 TaxID=3391836 RepID=UPI0039C93CFF
MIPNIKEQNFESMLKAHKGILHKIANSYSYCYEERRDLIQDIRLQLWRSFDSYDPSLKLSTWVYRVALNTAISFLRTQSLRKDYIEVTNTGVLEEPIDSKNSEVLIEVQRLLKLLNKYDRALFIMHLDGLSHNEIADVLDISTSNVGTKISRIKQSLNALYMKGDSNG